MARPTSRRSASCQCPRRQTRWRRAWSTRSAADLMAATAPTALPDGGAGTPPLRRPGALRAIIRNGSVIRWLGLGGAVVPVLMLAFVLLTLIFKSIPALR